MSALAYAVRRDDSPSVRRSAYQAMLRIAFPERPVEDLAPDFDADRDGGQMLIRRYL